MEGREGRGCGKGRRPFSLFFLWLLSVLLFSCGPREDPPAGEGLLDALGRFYRPGNTPARIVSLTPAVTEILFAIGAGDNVVGVTQYCDYPPAALEKTSVGGFSGATMSLEQIRVLNPDLVILSADMHARIVALLDELDIPSFAVEPRNFSQVYEAIGLIGEITGFPGGAEKVTAEMKGKIARIEELVQGRVRPQVFWLLAGEPLMSVGRETFVSEAISLAGGRNIFDDVREQWPLVSAEQVLMRRPDWIFQENDGAGALGGTALQFWQTLPALREDRRAYINPDTIYRYGPRLAEGVEYIARILHDIESSGGGL